MADTNARSRGMAPGLRGERLVALFLAGWIAFNPPILSLFGVPATVFGLPLLYLYLFALWAIVIVLAAVIVGRPETEPPPPRTTGAPAAPDLY